MIGTGLGLEEPGGAGGIPVVVSAGFGIADGRPEGVGAGEEDEAPMEIFSFGVGDLDEEERDSTESK
jgi:hypothetical protein